MKQLEEALQALSERDDVAVEDLDKVIELVDAEKFEEAYELATSLLK